MTRFRVQAESPHHLTGEVTQGPVEHISIFPQALANILGPEPHTPEKIHAALREWMAPRHQEMLVRKRHIEAVSGVSAELEGQKLEFD
jgi:hypothetical protein